MPKSRLTRRSILDTLDVLPSDQPTNSTSHLNSNPAPKDILSSIKLATKRQRNRQWERAFKAKTYRGVAPQMQAALKAAATDQQCTIDQAATAFLQYSLFCHQRGDQDLELEPALHLGRLTLFPEGEPDSVPSRRKVGWQEKIWNLNPPEHKKRYPSPNSNHPKERPWKDWVGYRLPEPVVEGIDEIRKNMGVPAGEVVTRLLEHANQAYCAGRLVLTFEACQRADCQDG